jgi:hypothetical protein
MQAVTNTASVEPSGRRLNHFCHDMGVSISTAYREINAGRLAVTKVGRCTVILDTDAARWVEARRTPMQVEVRS